MRVVVEPFETRIDGKPIILDHAPGHQVSGLVEMLKIRRQDAGYRSLCGLQAPDPSFNQALGSQLHLSVGGGRYCWFCSTHTQIITERTKGFLSGNYDPNPLPLPNSSYLVRLRHHPSHVLGRYQGSEILEMRAAFMWLHELEPTVWDLQVDVDVPMRAAMHASVDAGVAAHRLVGPLNSADVSTEKAKVARSLVRDAMLAAISVKAPLGTEWVVVPGFYSGIHPGTVKILGSPLIALMSPVQPRFPLALLTRSRFLQQEVVYCGFYGPSEGFCEHPPADRADRWCSIDDVHNPTGSMGVINTLAQWYRMSRGEALAERDFDWRLFEQ